MRVANQAIKREKSPISTVEEIVQEMSGACHFSKLKLRPGYHQLELNAALQKMTSFSTHFELRRHKRPTVRVTKASEHYQQTFEQNEPT